MTNYVKPLALFQSGVEAVRATGTLTIDEQITAADTMVIGGITYTFRAAGDTDAPGEISIGDNEAEAKANIEAAINGDALNEANPYVTAGTFVGDVLTLTARIAGPAGNLITLAETFTAAGSVFNGTGFLGGTVSGSHARGTAVAATSKLVFPVDFDADDTVERTPYALGIAFENVGHEAVTKRGTKFTIPDHPLNFEQLPLYGSWAVKGGVLPSGGDAEGGNVTFTFTPSLSADPALVSRTLERRLTNGANSLDDEWAYAMLESWGVKWAQGALVQQHASGFARRRKDSTLTAAQAAPDPITQAPASLVTVFIDDDWASLGGTQITGQIIGGDFEYMTGYGFEETADGRADLDFHTHEFRPRSRRFTLKMRRKVSHGNAIVERAKAEAASLRAVRIAIEDPTTEQTLTLDMLVKHVPGTHLVKVDEVDDQDVVELDFIQSTDGTNCFSMVVESRIPTDA